MIFLIYDRAVVHYDWTRTDLDLSDLESEQFFGMIGPKGIWIDLI